MLHSIGASMHAHVGAVADVIITTAFVHVCEPPHAVIKNARAHNVLLPCLAHTA